MVNTLIAHGRIYFVPCRGEIYCSRIYKSLAHGCLFEDPSDNDFKTVPGISTVHRTGKGPSCRRSLSQGISRIQPPVLTCTAERSGLLLGVRELYQCNSSVPLSGVEAAASEPSNAPTNVVPLESPPSVNPFPKASRASFSRRDTARPEDRFRDQVRMKNRACRRHLVAETRELLDSIATVASNLVVGVQIGIIQTKFRNFITNCSLTDGILNNSSSVLSMLNSK